MYLSPKTLKTPLDITIEFRTAVDIPPGKSIGISLPRFTRDLRDDNVTYSNITYSKLLISPSYMFDAMFIEGSPNYDKDGNLTLPYSSAMIILKPLSNATIVAYSTIPLRIYKENGIGTVCGFPDSQTATNFINSIKPFKNFKIYTLDQLPGTNITKRSSDTFSFTSYDGIGNGCRKQNDCNGNGVCDYCYETCSCNEGYGSITDIGPKGSFNPSCADRKLLTMLLFSSCRLRQMLLLGVCPYGKAIGDLPTAPDKAHAYAECSNQGICNRANGTCNCFPPFTGSACDKCK